MAHKRNGPPNLLKCEKPILIFRSGSYIKIIKQIGFARNASFSRPQQDRRDVSPDSNAIQVFGFYDPYFIDITVGRIRPPAFLLGIHNMLHPVFPHNARRYLKMHRILYSASPALRKTDLS